MGSPSRSVALKRGPSVRQGMTTPTWQASVKGAQARWLNSPLVYKMRCSRAGRFIFSGRYS